jgi:hypothetical protein
VKFIILFALAIVVGCATQPSLEELEDEATNSGDWIAVERREEIVKKDLESRGPGCLKGLNKYCIEEQSGIECYCVPLTIYSGMKPNDLRSSSADSEEDIV